MRFPTEAMVNKHSDQTMIFSVEPVFRAPFNAASALLGWRGGLKKLACLDLESFL